MTHQVLFVQGGGAGTHDEWDNRLVDSLGLALGPDYAIRYPRMPEEADPDYMRWKTAIESEIAQLDDGAILVGHSVGATVLVNALATDAPRITLDGIFLLAAPFVGEGGWPSDDIDPQRKLGPALPRGIPVYLYHGTEDETAPFAHAELYARAIPQATLRRLEGRDHQLDNDLREVAADMLALHK